MWKVCGGLGKSMEQGFGAGQTCERFKITTIEYEAINIEC